MTWKMSDLSNIQIQQIDKFLSHVQAKENSDWFENWLVLNHRKPNYGWDWKTFLFMSWEFGEPLCAEATEHMALLLYKKSPSLGSRHSLKIFKHFCSPSLFQFPTKRLKFVFPKTCNAVCNNDMCSLCECLSKFWHCVTLMDILTWWLRQINWSIYHHIEEVKKNCEERQAYKHDCIEKHILSNKLDTKCPVCALTWVEEKRENGVEWVGIEEDSQTALCGPKPGWTLTGQQFHVIFRSAKQEFN